MKHLYTSLTILFAIPTFASSRSSGQDGVKATGDSICLNPNYDKELAEKLGADDYGMKSYFFVISKKEFNETEDAI
jgi:uncharacterized protein